MPDKILGEKLCVFVQPVKGETISLDDIVSYLKEQGMVVYSLPERLEIVDGWPLTAKNAIDKRLLRAYITAKAVQEGVVTQEHADDYLKKDGISVNDIINDKLRVEFEKQPG